MLRNGDTHEHAIFRPSSFHNPIHTFLGRQPRFLNKTGYNLLGPFPFLVTDSLLMVFVEYLAITHPGTGPIFPQSMSKGFRVPIGHATVTIGVITIGVATFQ